MAKKTKARAYSAKQLSAFGFGEISGIRKRTKRESCKITIREVSGNKTKHYLFSTLPAEWQEKIHTAEEAERKACEYEAALKVHDEELNRIAEQKYNDEMRETRSNDFAKKKEGAKQEAYLRAQAVAAWENRVYGEKLSKGKAYKLTAKEFNCSENTLRNWVKLVEGIAKPDRPTVLVSQCPGRTVTAEFTEEAWEYIKADYLRFARPTIAACYDRAQRIAPSKGWKIPCLKTVENRIKRDIPRNILILKRHGTEALEATYPAQQRDTTVFHAMEAVNGDGYQFWPYVDFGDGVVTKATSWVWQDILSSKILAWRVDVSENTEVIRLATGDLVRDYGIPSHFWLDNTRAAANKTMTGGVKNRFRFKIKDEDPVGVIPMLGALVHWTTPGHGQSKPVERAFGIGGLSEYVDKHPAFDGRGTKAKPIPLAEFEKILADEIKAWNARSGRRGRVAFGRSFDDVFHESYRNSKIVKATSEQQRLFMLACENVHVSRVDASITMRFYNGPQGENRYWNEALSRYAGRKITVRFDPASLQGEVYCYSLSGDFICAAQCILAAGFNDADAAREHHRQRAKHKKATKEQAKALITMKAIEAAQMLPESPGPDAPATPKIIQGKFKAGKTPESIGKAVNNDAVEDIPEEMQRNFERGMEILREQQKNRI